MRLTNFLVCPANWHRRFTAGEDQSLAEERDCRQQGNGAACSTLRESAASQVGGPVPRAKGSNIGRGTAKARARSNWVTPSLSRLSSIMPSCSLPGGPGAHLHSGAEQARRFARWPGVVERAAKLGGGLALDLRLGGLEIDSHTNHR